MLKLVLLGVFIGFILANLCRYLFPWLFDKHLFYSFYENNVMGTWLGRFKIAQKGSTALFLLLFKKEVK